MILELGLVLFEVLSASIYTLSVTSNCAGIVVV